MRTAVATRLRGAVRIETAAVRTVTLCLRSPYPLLRMALPATRFIQRTSMPRKARDSPGTEARVQALHPREAGLRQTQERLDIGQHLDRPVPHVLGSDEQRPLWITRERPLDGRRVRAPEECGDQWVSPREVEDSLEPPVEPPPESLVRSHVVVGSRSVRMKRASGKLAATRGSQWTCWGVFSSARAFDSRFATAAPMAARTSRGGTGGRRPPTAASTSAANSPGRHGGSPRWASLVVVAQSRSRWIRRTRSSSSGP